MSKSLIALLFSFVFVLYGCSEPVVEKPEVSLSDQIDNLVISSEYSIEDVPGNSDVEKLLYLMDIPTALQSTTLVILDGQITSFEAAGNTKAATQLKENRKIMLEVLRDTTPSLVTLISPVYQQTFTADEIKRLTILFSDPVAQKMFKSQRQITKDILPAVEEWSNEFEEALVTALETQSE